LRPVASGTRQALDSSHANAGSTKSFKEQPPTSCKRDSCSAAGTTSWLNGSELA
jgi:hypothetical protein